MKKIEREKVSELERKSEGDKEHERERERERERVILRESQRLKFIMKSTLAQANHY